MRTRKRGQRLTLEGSVLAALLVISIPVHVSIVGHQALSNPSPSLAPLLTAPPLPPTTPAATARPFPMPAGSDETPVASVASTTPPATPRPMPQPTRAQTPRPTASPTPPSGGWVRDPETSWYGPGFYGGRTACGVTLTRETLGVAHRSLPCGTMVEFRSGMYTALVPVIDRGPYVAGRQWDLTGATCTALRHCFTGPLDYRFP